MFQRLTRMTLQRRAAAPLIRQLQDCGECNQTREELARVEEKLRTLVAAVFSMQPPPPADALAWILATNYVKESQKPHG